MAVTLKNLGNSWKTLEMHLINCGINLSLTWSANCVICKVDRATTFSISDTKSFVPVATLSTQDNTKLLQP